MDADGKRFPAGLKDDFDVQAFLFLKLEVVVDVVEGCLLEPELSGSYL